MHEGLAGADPAQSMTGGKAGVPCDGWGQRSMYAVVADLDAFSVLFFISSSK